MKKTISIIVVVVLLLAAQAYVFSSGQDESKVAGKAVTIEAWFPEYEGGVVEEVVLPEFYKEHSNIKVNLVKVPWENVSEKLSVSIAGEVMPDVAAFASDTTLISINLKALEPLDAFMKKQGLTKDDFYPGSFDSFVSSQGRTYGIPAWMELTAPYWRTDLFKQAGYDRAPKTWEELLAYGKKLTVAKKKDGEIDQYMINIPYTGEWIWYVLADWLYQGGGGIISKDGSKVMINSNASVDAIIFYRDLSKKYKIALPPELSSAYGGEEFMNGKAAIIIQGGWFKGAIRDKMGAGFEKNWDISLPFKGKQISLMGDPGVVYTIPSKKNKNASWIFITELLKSARFYEKTSVIPTSKAIMDSDTFKSDAKNAVYFELIPMIKSGEVKPWGEVATPKLGEVHEAVNRMIQQIVFSNADPQKAADDCAEAIKKSLGIK